MSELVIGAVYDFNQVRAELLYLKPPRTPTVAVWKEAPGRHRFRRVSTQARVCTAVAMGRSVVEAQRSAARLDPCRRTHRR